MSYRVFALTLALGIMSATSVCEAQAQSYVSAQSAMPSSRVLITYRTTGASLETVLREIGQQAGMQLSWSRSDVRLDQRVAVSVERVSLTTALAIVTKGTGVEARVAPDGETIMISRAVAAAQAAGTIVGKVIHAKTKQPVAGATISVDENTKGTTTTDDGSFRISVNAAGDHVVHVRALGFVRQSRRITVGDGQVVTGDFTLDPSASVLDEVIVTGTVVATERKAIPNPITVITAEDIERRGITRVEQLLRGEVPGVIATDVGGQVYNPGLGFMIKATTYSRGSSGLDASGVATPLKTYIDGVELLDPSYLGTIDPKSIERIEIITGPQAATVYGSGSMGGVMQIFTKKGIGQLSSTATLSLRYGFIENNLSDSFTPSHNDAFSVSGGAGPLFSYSANMSYTYSGQWQPDLFNRTMGASVGITHARGPFTAGGSVSATAGTNGTFGGNPLRRTRYLAGLGPYDSDEMLHKEIRGTSSSQTIAMNVDYRASAAWQHHLTVGRSQTNLGLIPQAPRFTDARDTMFNVTTSTGQRTSLGYNTTILMPAMGVFSSTTTLGVTGSIGNQLEVSGCLASKTATAVVNCYGTSGLTVGKPLTNQSWGGFGRWQLGLFDQFYLTLGLRAERNPNYGRNHRIDWTPTNGVAYTIERGDLTVKLLGSYGRATRAPDPSYRLETLNTSVFYSPSRYVSRLANPDLTPEYSRGPQGGIELYYGNVGSLTINHFQQKVTDLIQSVTVDSIYLTVVSTGATQVVRQQRWVNAATVRQQGWEGTGSVNLGALTVKGTYSWSDSRIISVSPKLSSTQVGQSFKNVPTHAGNVMLNYARAGTSASLSLDIMGTMLAWCDQTALRPFLVGMSESRTVMYEPRASYACFDVTRPGYVRSHLAAAQQLTPWASVTLNVSNLGNTYGQEASVDNPTIGRVTLLGLSLRFPRTR